MTRHPRMGAAQQLWLLYRNHRGMITRSDALGTRTLLSDALGSTLALTDPAGSVLARYTYEPFGTTTVTGSAFSPYQYTGRENDDTGLYYYRARYYNPVLQRFISEDPIGFRGGINVYSYVGNNPAGSRDPLGLWSPEAHDQIFDLALGDCAAPSDIDALKGASRAFDKQTQAEEFSNLHSMLKAGQSLEDFFSARSGFIDGFLHAAQSQQLAGNHAGALRLAAPPMHTISDSFSPLHTGPNGDPYTWGCGPLCWPNNLLHSPDNLWGQETTRALRRLSDQAYLDLRKRLREAYSSVFGPCKDEDTSGRKSK